MEKHHIFWFMQSVLSLCVCLDHTAERQTDDYTVLQETDRTKRFLEDPSDVHIFVNPNGSDVHNDGLSTDSPLKSIVKALSMLTSYKGRNVYIELMRGFHDLDRTLHIHHTDPGKLTVRAYKGEEVHLTGGIRLESNVFKPVTDQHALSRVPEVARNHVRVDHLPDLNITNYGSIHRFGMYYSRKAPLEVFVNGEPMRLARWPNQGYINIVGLIDGEHGQTFRYSSNRPSTWEGEQDIWAYGFWRWSWADRAIKVQTLSTSNMTVTLAEKTTYGLTLGHWNESSNKHHHYTQQGGYFRFFNVLSELDEPGEYYLDKSTGDLYVWMPSSSTSDVVYISMIDNCIQLGRGSENVVLEDFTLESCRAIGILGTDVSNITIHHMEVRNTGGYNIVVSGHSSNVKISRSYLHDGSGAINLYGGNRNTLQSSGHIVEDNEIWRYSREGAAGYNAVMVSGVGTIVRHNNMYVGQYDAVKYQGNNHIFEYNQVNHTCMNASDCGAFMTGRDWTSRGNTIQYNHIHHTLRLVPGADNRGIMLDDQSSGTIIKNNVFYDNEVHVNIGGGRDNVVENNVMYNATSYSMQVDGRGIHNKNDQDLIRNLKAVPYNSTAWTTAYPEMIGFDHQNKSLPEGNQIHRNLFYNDLHIETIHGLNGFINKPTMFNVTQSGWSLGPSDFYDIHKGDFRVRCYALEWANHVHFPQPVTRGQVGPRYAFGPTYKRQAPSSVLSSGGPPPCTTHAPATSVPIGSYLPDGSAPNTLFNVTKQGCWLNVAACTADPKSIGIYRDVYGETHSHAAENETECFHRAVEKWKYCGSHHNEQVVAIFGPTGATTLIGDGCYMAWYGCPQHGGPVDGHVIPGRFSRDVWAEQHQNAANNEAACLSRALPQWVYCGSNKNHPITSIYRPTGAIRTAGAGCWIKVEKCPLDPNLKLSFYDSWAATNLNADENESACLARASHYWEHCGSNPGYHVTAFYRPKAASRTVP